MAISARRRTVPAKAVVFPFVPDRPFEFALIVAATFSMLNASAGIIGALSIAGGAVLLSLMRRDVTGQALKWWPLFGFCLLQVLTTVWSLDRGVTIRYSLQLLLTAYVGVFAILARRPTDLIRAIVIGGLAAVALSLVSGVKGHFSATGETLVGLMGSKNAMSYTAGLVAQACLALLVLRVSFLWKALGLVGFLVCFAVAVSVHAAMGTISAALGVLLFPTLWVASRLPKSWRDVLVALVVLFSVMGGLIWLQIGNQITAMVLGALHKDPGLTGRAQLWAFAHQFIQARPILGRGYKEVWVGQSVDTIGLLRWAGLTDGRTFYFHQTYIEATVDSGYIGVTLLILTYIAIAYGFVRKFIAGMSDGVQFFFIMFLLLMLRSFTETLMQPFGQTVFIVYAAGVAAWADMPRAVKASPRPRDRSRWSRLQNGFSRADWPARA